MVLLTDSAVGCNNLMDHLQQCAVFSPLSHCSAISELSVPGVGGGVEQCAGGAVSRIVHDSAGHLHKNFS